MKEEKKTKNQLSNSFKIGAIALIFLIIGFQFALFSNKVILHKILSSTELRDTVYIYTYMPDNQENIETNHSQKSISLDKYSNMKLGKSTANQDFNTINKAKRRVKEAENKDFRRKQIKKELKNKFKEPKNFKFNPNTATQEDFENLGFSEKQALSIINYRKKGGYFHRKEDFQKSFVVSPQIYSRLESFIEIPKLDINTADSAALDRLPGIGKYFVHKILDYRKKLGSYSYIEQLMDIYHFDKYKFDKLSDLICVDSLTIQPYPIWSLPEDSLSLHPYIGKYAAHSIVLFRENTDKEQLNIENLLKANIIQEKYKDKLRLCIFK